MCVLYACASDVPVIYNLVMASSCFKQKISMFLINQFNVLGYCWHILNLLYIFIFVISPECRKSCLACSSDSKSNLTMEWSSIISYFMDIKRFSISFCRDWCITMTIVLSRFTFIPLYSVRDISSNTLSGIIPQSLDKLTKLSTL